jgi:rhodanese-related sulfurtransferase
MASEIPVDEAIERASKTGWLLDVREQGEWDAVNTPVAHLIPMSQINERIEEVPLGEPILVICHSGFRSAKVAAALVDAGYDAVSVAGGMVAWQSAGGVVREAGSSAVDA